MPDKTRAIEINGDPTSHQDPATYEESNLVSTTDIESSTLEVEPSISFSIGGAGVDETVEASVDKVAYRSHIISIDITNSSDYYLLISGQDKLTLEGGTTSLTGITSGNIIGENIPAGQWGYGWDYTGRQSNAEMLYKSIPIAATKLTQPALNNNAVSFAGKLTFAAKFPNNAVLGKYSSNVTLTLVVTPKIATGKTNWRDATGAITTYEIGTTTMQNIENVSHGEDGGFCKNNKKVGEGWTANLTDARGKGTDYTIVKLNGNCWMAENLKLSGPLVLTTDDTDLFAGSEAWTLPKDAEKWNSTLEGTGQDNGNNVAQIKTGSTSISGWKPGYGNYYSWCAATAETCLNASGNPISSTDAPSSICPKGWKLPPNSGTNSYSNLSSYKLWQTNQTINGVTGFSGYRLGYNNPNTSSEYYWTNFWPAAGAFHGSLANANSNGDYWARTAPSNSSNAYRINFNSAGVNPTGTYNRYRGFPVRCVASY